jgi:hypothetical protein
MYSPIMPFLFLAVSGITELPRVAAHVRLGARVRLSTAARPARVAGILTGADRDSFHIALDGGTDTVVVVRSDVRDFEYLRPALAHRTARGEKAREKAPGRRPDGGRLAGARKEVPVRP